jgi:diguanylate cyclase (GGDEF)-like protein/PAS domain S-box-containing protein
MRKDESTTNTPAEPDHIGGLPLTKTMVPNSFGAIWCDAAADRYQADAFACELLSVAPHGRLREPWLQELRRHVAPSAEQPQRFHTFRNRAGAVLRARLLPDVNSLSVIVVDDLQNIADRFRQLGQSEREYRELFENASYGLYRANLQGVVTQANPAYLRLHGFDSEAEMAAAMGKASHQYYVEPERLNQFLAELDANGKVIDFVSEVFRHRTRERIWISESAWLVRDAAGRPGYLAGTVVEITERMRYLEKVRLAAETDALTGLANRARFNAEVESRIAARPEAGLAVLIIDCDRFKEINDVYGHARGDAVLRVCARRLTALVPQGGMLARLGGDEFAMLLPDSNVNSPITIADSISGLIALPIEIDGASHLIGASTGIALFPQHGNSARDLLKNADLALYNVKDCGRGHARLFDTGLERVKQHRHAIERDLRGAETRGELELHYQPVVNAGTSSVVGVEALLRWRHPVRGMLLPGDFIPVAEDSGLMLKLGEWAIHEACRHAAAIPAPLMVAINVSALQFRSSDLPGIVAAAVAANNVDPRRIELEVTETVMIRNEVATLHTFERLRALGVKIALDDFGTGYSSLSYLQRFRFDKVKIDRSFIGQIRSNATNRAVTRAILSIGRDLGLEVVAEGIESQADSDELLREGCSLQQGHFFGCPETLAEISVRLAVAALEGAVPGPLRKTKATQNTAA